MKKTDKHVKQLESIARVDKIDFDELLQHVIDIDPQTKALWIEVYHNATYDRECASMLYTDIFREMQGNPQGHAIYGQLVTKYIERMTKASDQLLRIVDQITMYRKNERTIDSDAILDEINDIS